MSFRFQLVTKQVDADVARAYLAVQEVDDAHEDGVAKEDQTAPARATELDGRAINRYFEDDGWEEQAERPSTIATTKPKQKKQGVIDRLLGGQKAKSSKGSSAVSAVRSDFKQGALVQGAPWS